MSVTDITYEAYTVAGVTVVNDNASTITFEADCGMDNPHSYSSFFITHDKGVNEGQLANYTVNVFVREGGGTGDAEYWSAIEVVWQKENGDVFRHHRLPGLSYDELLNLWEAC